MDTQRPDRLIKPGQKIRIETQIHRRRKAKALSPLEAEWDSSQPLPPATLRMSRAPQSLPDRKKQS